jgi:uncharacterized membrane protein
VGVTYRLVGFDAAETGRLTQGPARLRPAATLRLRSIITGGRLNLSASYGPTGRGKPNMAGCAAAALTMFRTAAETEMTPNTPLNKCNRAIRSHAWGLLLVVATAVGWGLGWPTMKLAMHDWPPLFARGCAGLAAALGLAIIAVVRGQNLLPSRSLVPRLALGAAINVFAWMGFTALALLWLTVAQAALLTYSMPIWATLLAWPILGERPRLRSVIALCLGMAGLVLLMGANLGGGVGGQRYATIPSSEVDGRDQSATPHSDLRDWR